MTIWARDVRGVRSAATGLEPDDGVGEIRGSRARTLDDGDLSTHRSLSADDTPGSSSRNRGQEKHRGPQPYADRAKHPEVARGKRRKKRDH